MDEILNKTAEEAAAFQKIWIETMSKLVQAGFTISPSSPPPEMARQVRAGMFQALASSWDEFMRSPQFLEGVRQWMENAITFRRLTNDFMARVRNELQAPSRGDIDTIMLTVRHMEKRLLDRMDELSAEVAELKQQAGGRKRQPQQTTSRKSSQRSTRVAEARTARNGNEVTA